MEGKRHQDDSAGVPLGEEAAAPDAAAVERDTFAGEERSDETPIDEAAEAGQPVAEAPPPAAEDLSAELAEAKDRLLRTLAEMENLRRRTAREVDEARRFAITGFARDLLEVADNLSRALASVPPKAREKIELIKNLADGVAMTEKALLGVFERHQVSKVEPAIGDRFDHNRHQAMFEVETDQQEPGSVAQVMAPGYVLADRLLRPAMVGVAKAVRRQPEAPSPEPAAEPSAEESRPGGHIDTTA